jgi:hypothetical protein
MPTVTSITLSPSSPVGRGPVAFTILFSKPMDNTVYPSVTFTPQGAASGISLMPSSYLGNTWTGSVTIASSMNSGSAALQVSGAQDPSGNAAPATVFVFQINIPLPPVPQNTTASWQPATGQVQMSWQAAPGLTAAGYNLYRASYPFTSRSGLAPIQTNLSGTIGSDVPPPDSPFAYYAVTALDDLGGETEVSANASIALPLPPVITSPANNASVDFSSTNVQGLAQPGALIDISTSIAGVFGQPLTTVTVLPDRTWSAHLTLGHGPFTIDAVSRSSVTGLVSSATVVTINLIDLPSAPAGFQATAGDTIITLSWTQSGQSTVAGYNLYRDGSAVPLNVTPLPVNQTSYQDLALTDGRTYSYVITAIDNAGHESYPSPAVQATPAAEAGWGTP